MGREETWGKETTITVVWRQDCDYGVESHLHKNTHSCCQTHFWLHVLAQQGYLQSPFVSSMCFSSLFDWLPASFAHFSGSHDWCFVISQAFRLSLEDPDTGHENHQELKLTKAGTVGLTPVTRVHSSTAAFFILSYLWMHPNKAQVTWNIQRIMVRKGHKDKNVYVGDKVRKAKFKWFRHLLGRDNGRITQRTLNTELPGRKRRFMDVVKEPIEMFEGEAKDKTEGKTCWSITKLGVDSLQGKHWEITQWNN